MKQDRFMIKRFYLVGSVVFCMINISFVGQKLLRPFGIIRHDVNIDEYRRVGQKDEFNCVGRYSTGEGSTEFAAGVLISPNWVLTAAHFVQDSSVWLFGEKYYKSEMIVRNPKLSHLEEGRKLQWDGWDLALIKLNKPVVDIKPAIRYKHHSELGMIIYKIGYGYIGDGSNGMSEPFVQERLGGKNTIDRIGGDSNGLKLGDDVLLCDFDSPITSKSNHFGSPLPLQLEIGGSKGDSGGGVFTQISNELVLVGIVSGGLDRNVGYGSRMAFSRVSSANAWIDKTIESSTDDR